MSEKEEKRFVPHSHIPYGADGSGYYSDHHVLGHNINNAAIPLLVDAVQSTDIQPGSVFTIVDYGTADGGNSMPLMYACVKAIREKHGDELPINIIYEDQPVNDFKSLFMRLQGLIPGPPSYLADFSNVFVMACGTNYYQHCFARNSVNLGFSAASMHWLSEKPCDLTDSLFVHLNTVPEEIEKFREQAARDWERLLLNRASELKPGGKMVFAMASRDEQWKDAERLESNFSWYHLISILWKGLVDDGTITEKEFKNTNFISYWRSSNELKKPFECETSPVIQAGLELVAIETRPISCGVKDEWLKEKSNFKGYAERFVAFIRTWGHSTLMSGLSDTRSKEEKTQIVEEFFRRMDTKITNSKKPEYFSPDRVLGYVTVQKQVDGDNINTE